MFSRIFASSQSLEGYRETLSVQLKSADWIDDAGATGARAAPRYQQSHTMSIRDRSDRCMKAGYSRRRCSTAAS